MLTSGFGGCILVTLIVLGGEVMKSAEEIGRRLRELRTAHGKTTGELSIATGIGRTALSNYELGYRIPRDRTKEVLAAYYKMTVDELFYR